MFPTRSPAQLDSGPACDPVDEALAVGLAEASRAGRWEVVTILARELEARRLVRTDIRVVPLRASKRADGQ